MEQTITVETTKAQLLATIEGHAIPIATYPRQLTKLQYGTEDISSYAISLTFEGARAIITCQIPLGYASQGKNEYGMPLDHFVGRTYKWYYRIRGNL